MLADPQRFNLYSYVRNNPLRFIDPEGEAIRLSDNEEERKKQLAALQSAVGQEAGGYLYANKIEKKDENGNVTSTEYYVGIYENGPEGKGPAFDQINPVAGEFSPIICDTNVATISTVLPGTSIGGMVISPKGGDAAGLTAGTGTNVMIFIAFPQGPIGGKTERSQWDAVAARKMSDGNPGYRDSGTVMAHELGHARGRMTGDYHNGDTSDAARRLENKVRKLRDPKAATRKEH